VSNPVIRVVLIESDRAILARAAHRLAHAGVHVVVRPAPAEALDYIDRVQPEVVLLGRRYWARWARRIRTASPETVVFPALEVPPLSAGRAA
jgi:DNA-binding response OmpR family regulator